MGCQGGRGTLCVLGALLVGALASAAPASAAGAITVSGASVSESAGSVTFTLTRDAGLLEPATTVAYQTADGTARAPGDYTATSGTTSFAFSLLGGTQTQQVAVPIRNDTLDEADETFTLSVSGDGVSGGSATATILDDDPSPSLSVADPAPVTEGAPGAHATFVVRPSVVSGRDISVAYATANGSALAGQDYTARSGTLVIPAGAAQASVDVAVLDDAINEPTETFDLRLSSPVAATLADASATATILDDDAPPAATPPPATPAPGTPASPAAPVTLPALPTTTAPTTGSSTVRVSMGLSSPQLKRPSTVLVTLSCPQSAGRCSGKITIFSIPSKHSKIKALRRERKLGQVAFSLAGGQAKTLSLVLGRSDRALLQRTGRMNVRAYAVLENAAGQTGVRSVSGTLIARTSHSSPSR